MDNVSDIVYISYCYKIEVASQNLFFVFLPIIIINCIFSENYLKKRLYYKVSIFLVHAWQIVKPQPLWVIFQQCYGGIFNNKYIRQKSTARRPIHLIYIYTYTLLLKLFHADYVKRFVNYLLGKPYRYIQYKPYTAFYTRSNPCDR